MLLKQKPNGMTKEEKDEFWKFYDEEKAREERERTPRELRMSYEPEFDNIW